jgi:TIR domain-containing protein
LQRAGLVAWLDREVIPTQNRENEIRKAIESIRYVIALISSKSIEKIGSIQLDNQSEFQKAVLFARLDDCEVPGELKNIKYVDLFPKMGRGNKKNSSSNWGLTYRTDSTNYSICL